MKKIGLMDKPKIEILMAQVEYIIQHEMQWSLTYPGDTPNKVLKAMNRVLKYYSTKEEYEEFMESLVSDWREHVQ